MRFFTYFYANNVFEIALIAWSILTTMYLCFKRTDKPEVFIALIIKILKRIEELQKQQKWNPIICLINITFFLRWVEPKEAEVQSEVTKEVNRMVNKEEKRMINNNKEVNKEVNTIKTRMINLITTIKMIRRKRKMTKMTLKVVKRMTTTKKKSINLKLRFRDDEDFNDDVDDIDYDNG